MLVEGYVLDRAGAPLTKRALPQIAASSSDAVVEVDACGLCHTDLAFANGSVAPKHSLPLVLGHEIVGTVVETDGAFASLRGRRVLVPAVIPCGDCAFCRAGRGNACPRQKMPGNDIDGGFATHVVVPAWALVPLDDAPASIDARELGVVADAVSTAYQATRRATLARGDVAVVVGSGGVGCYVIQIARALGARVIACDTRAERLDLVARHGAERTVCVEGRAARDVRKEAHAMMREWGVPSLALRIFECSGTKEGQELAFTMLAQAATLVVVGFSVKPLELRLSNVMAFDATLHGTWGCPPDAYKDVLRLIYAGDVKISPFVEHAPMSCINEALDNMAHDRLSRRLILDPRT